MADENDFKPDLEPSLLGKVELAVHDDEASKRWPALMRLLLPRYDAKRRCTREAGVIRLACGSGVFRLTVMCPSEGAQTTLQTTTLIDNMDQLELHVSDASVIWEQTFDEVKQRKEGLDKARRKRYT